VLERSLSGQDGLLMEYVYSRESKHFSLKALCRMMARAYGLSISIASLQSAMLARFASYLPPSNFGTKEDDHTQRSQRELIRKTAIPPELTEADFFASFILATLAWDNKRDDETIIHYRGCLAMWDHLTANTTPSSILMVVGPYALDTLSFCDKIACITNSKPWESVIQRKAHFQQRAEYFEKLRPTCDRTGIPGIAEAVHDFMNDLFSILITVIMETARAEASNEVLADGKVEAVLRYIEKQSSTADFRSALKVVEQFSRDNDDPECYQLARAQQMQIRLAISILRDGTILSSLGIEDVSAQADRLISHFRERFRGVLPPRSYYYASGLALAGLALSETALKARIFQVYDL
jgi:hypothetical protein